MAHQRGSIEKNDVESIDHKDIVANPNTQAIDIAGFRVFGLDPVDAEFFSSYPDEKRKKVFRKVRLSVF
jgi:hypothetical protein